MVASAGAMQTRELGQADFMAAACAVFGALELIGESECSERTRANLDAALVGAERCLDELGLGREELGAGPGWRPGARCGPPHPGVGVVPLRRR